MQKPTIPQKPVEPTLDNVPLYSEKQELVFNAKEYCSLVDLNNAIEKYKDPTYDAYLSFVIKSDIYYDYDGGDRDHSVLLQIHATIKTELTQEEREEKLNYLMRVYKKQLSIYEKNHKNYDLRVEEYNNWLANKKQQELKKLEENRQKEIKRLDDQKKKLEKQLKKLEVK
jgi:hypothetical protein